ncbi:MAG: efflux RND transporter periplasmic adaptor subunit, partial [candidate division Zixibacteria bacterium]|nr:efflux RND transporter periplasmic adaptor subunit [candidate division Zixibacteria bacterium]
MKKYLFAGVIVIGLAAGVYGIVKLNGSTGSGPTIKASQGEFIISLATNGRLDAKRSMTVSTPRIRGSLQIVKMVPEGTMVNEGDFLLQFDPTQQETNMRDATAELKIAEANLERAKAQLDMDLKQLDLDLKKAERSFMEKQSEAPIIRKEAELEMELSRMKYDTQKIILEADIQKTQVAVDKARDQKDLAAKELKNMTLTAPIPGLVVYLEIWKGSMMDKVQEGDNPWSGQGLINLPDLSTMIVETTVSEVDISKIKKGQRSTIQLDAIPGPVFTGEVTDVGTLARPKERGSKINVFDIEIQLDTADTRLKPGMSARADIVIEEFADVLSVPLESVFEVDDTTIVYAKG